MSGSDYDDYDDYNGSDSDASTVLLDHNGHTDEDSDYSPSDTETDGEELNTQEMADDQLRQEEPAAEGVGVVNVFHLDPEDDTETDTDIDVEEEPMWVDEVQVSAATAAVVLVMDDSVVEVDQRDNAQAGPSGAVAQPHQPSTGQQIAQPSTSGHPPPPGQADPSTLAAEPPAVPSCSTVQSPPNRRLNCSQDSEEEGLTCSICLEMWNNAGPHRLVALKCGHLFGKSCIERWLLGNSQRCPQCNRKSRKADLRVIYAKNLKVGDTSELELVKKSLEKEVEKSRGYEFVIAEGNLKIHNLRSEIQELKKNQLECSRRQVISSPIKSSGSIHPNAGRQRKFKFVLEKSVDIIREGSCRVLGTTEFLNMVVVSQPNTISALFPGYGLKKMNTLDFHPCEFIPIHTREIRDVAFNPSRMDGLVLTASMDKTLKLTSVISNSIVQVFNANVEVWSCVWNLDNDSQFFAGVKNGSVLLFDIRQPATHVKEVLPIHHGYPVTSLQYVPMKPLESFSCGGLIVGQLGRCSFLEATNNDDYKIHILPIEGAVTSVSFENTSRHFMASCRPTQRQPLTTHTVCELTELTDATSTQRTCGSNEVRRFVGGGTQRMITKSRLIAHPTVDGQILACVGDESTASTVVWDVATGQNLQKLPANQPVLDICSVKGAGQNFLTALTERTVKVYKWQAE